MDGAYRGRSPLIDPQAGDRVRSHCGAFTRIVLARTGNAVRSHRLPSGKQRMEQLKEWQGWCRSARAVPLDPVLTVERPAPNTGRSS